ncbi:Cyclin [Thalictrum thalictroides]|uniref:Cyclin n=1 Tax=Thalictrum thalictroides TaxID=46969 RepID=A0A7J6XEN3_THATH|nr:Cyclin [Thalictrum thalictroides]
MNESASSILQQSNSVRKRKLPVTFTKKLRSKIPRRKRFQISPILTGSLNSLFSDDNKPELSAVQAASCASSCFPGEDSSLSTWLSAEPENKKRRSTRQKKSFEDVRGFEVARGADVQIFLQLENRPITRTYLKQIESERELKLKGYGDLGVELSETSCVESSSVTEIGVLIKSGELSENNLKFNDRAHRLLDKEEQVDLTAASDAISLSEVSCVQQENAQIVYEQGDFDEKSSKLKVAELTEDEANEDVSVFSDETNRAPELSFSEISGNYLESNVTTLDQKPKDLGLEYSLACSEKFSYEENSDYSTSHELILSEFESEFFPKSSSLEFSDYSPSMLIDSLDYSSQESDINCTPPVYFPFFVQYQKQFAKLNSSIAIEASNQVQEEFYDEFTLLRFQNEEYEESYRKFRCRERKLVLHDYAEDYSSITEFGDLVLKQRLLMINWIVQQSNALELHSETLFLGVSLLDRFLSQGYFKHKRKLQILGIACLTLATRIEENQPYNCVNKSTFHVGKNAYSRSEVIGMEWLVQEILNFQCFLPTIHNFLWFYLKAANANAEVEKRTNYLAVLSLLDQERLCYWPSTVAAGLVILASLAANQESSCQWVMETHVRTKNDDLPECIQSLEWLVNYVR